VSSVSSVSMCVCVQDEEKESLDTKVMNQVATVYKQAQDDALSRLTNNTASLMVFFLLLLLFSLWVLLIHVGAGRQQHCLNDT